MFCMPASHRCARPPQGISGKAAWIHRETASGMQVYHPYLLINKKRYAGLLWTNPDKWDKMDSKVPPPAGMLPCSSAQGRLGDSSCWSCVADHQPGWHHPAVVVVLSMSAWARLHGSALPHRLPGQRCLNQEGEDVPSEAHEPCTGARPLPGATPTSCCCGRRA